MVRKKKNKFQPVAHRVHTLHTLITEGGVYVSMIFRYVDNDELISENEINNV